MTSKLETQTKVIRPITITESMVLSTNLTDSTAEYSSASTYAIGDLVAVTSVAGGASADTNSIYRSKTGSNTGNDPVTDTTNWEFVSSVNQWKMFDAIPQDQSSRADSFTVTVKPGQVSNALALINVRATEAVISIDSILGGGNVYSETHSLVDTSLIGDWYDFFFEPIRYLGEYAITGLPTYTDVELTVTLNLADANALCGVMVFGQFAELGSAAVGSQFGLTDYSTINQTNGKFTITEGSYNKRVSATVMCETRLWSGVQGVFFDLRNTPVVWIGDETVPGSVLFGYYRDFKITVAEGLTRINLTINGLNAT